MAIFSYILLRRFCSLWAHIPTYILAKFQAYVGVNPVDIVWLNLTPDIAKAFWLVLIS